MSRDQKTFFSKNKIIKVLANKFRENILEVIIKNVL